MARAPASQPPRLPLIDRLLQGDSVEVDRNPERALRALRESVRRDLEILFNSRPRYLSFAKELTELEVSLISFGLPDLQTQRVNTAAQRETFRVELEKLIGRFEPRFRDLSVEIMTGDDETDRTLRFRLHAVLFVDPISEPILYDTMVDPVSGGLVLLGGRA